MIHLLFIFQIYTAYIYTEGKCCSLMHFYSSVAELMLSLGALLRRPILQVHNVLSLFFKCITILMKKSLLFIVKHI